MRVSGTTVQHGSLAQSRYAASQPGARPVWQDDCMAHANRERPLVLLTGANGNIGVDFAETWLTQHTSDYGLRLGTRREDYEDDRFDDIVVMDLEDRPSLDKAMRGVDCVVNMAGNPSVDATFDELLGPNIVGVYNLFEVAREAGVKRVINASSVHAVMGYPVDFQAHEHDPPRADTLYGVSKVYGEALCSSFSYEHGMSCIALRIGAYVADDEREHRVYCSDNPQLLDIVVSRRDLCQLIHRCIMAPDELTYAVFHGISNNRFKRMDIANARTLVGYEPQDDAFEWSKLVDFGPEEKV